MIGFESGREGAAQTLAVLSRMGKFGTDPFAENLSLELGEHSQQSGHGPAGGRSQIESVGERDEADAEVIQFLHPTAPKAGALGTPACRVASRSVTDLPHRSRRQTRTASISRRRAASISFPRIWRCAAPELTSFTCMAMVQPRRVA